MIDDLGGQQGALGAVALGGAEDAVADAVLVLLDDVFAVEGGPEGDGVEVVGEVVGEVEFGVEGSVGLGPVLQLAACDGDGMVGLDLGFEDQGGVTGDLVVLSYEVESGLGLSAYELDEAGLADVFDEVGAALAEELVLGAGVYDAVGGQQGQQQAQGQGDDRGLAAVGEETFAPALEETIFGFFLFLHVVP